VHLAVVDPGVGTTRRGVAIRAGRSLLVGPDNGLLPAAAEALGPISEVFLLNDESWFRTPVSSTFHGRDVFAPVAGRLAAGAQLSAVGDPLPAVELIRLPAPLRQVQTGALAAEAIDVDRFGNVALAAGAPDLATAGFRLGDRLQWQHGFVTLARTFADVAPGEPLLFVDSAGRLALAVRDGSAAERYQLTEGDSIAASAASAS
jgi:S-adenosylmethionine hydrolase